MEHGELIARLEAASEGSHELNRALGLAIGELHLDAKGDLYRIDRDDGSHSYGGNGDETIITPRWTTSLDAIVALIERKLPSADYDIHHRRAPYKPTVHWYDEKGEAWRVSDAQTKPLAACIALLQALRTQDQGDQTNGS